MGLTERIYRNTQLSYWEGRIPVNYVYTYGLALEEFFRGIREQGKFLASRCENCGVVYIPARIFCERCMSGIDGSFQVPGTGRVYAHTVVHSNRDQTPKENPVIVALIDMDETDGRLVHYLVGVEPEQVEAGMPVRPVLKEEEEREGHIEDIIGFEPA